MSEMNCNAKRHRRRRARVLSMLIAIATVFPFAAGQDLRAEDSVATGAKGSPPPVPAEFAFVYGQGYGGGDKYTQDHDLFEKQVAALRSGGINCIHVQYRDWRVPICRKHGMKMMIDLMAGHYGVDMTEPNQPTVKAFAEQLRDEPAIWGYNISNDRMNGYTIGGLVDKHVALLHEWDPTHPVWCGTYGFHGIAAMKENPGVFAYYDYHWARNMDWHFFNLTWYHQLVSERGGRFGRWCLAMDYPRNKYTLNTSIAFGLKVAAWFGCHPWDNEKEALIEDYHLVKLGREMQSMYGEIGKIGHPYGVYSTPVARTPDNRAIEEPTIPRHLVGFPEDHWLQIGQGEAVVGFFEYPDGGEAVYFANHNAYAWQGIVFQIEKKEDKLPAICQFDKATGKWAEAASGEVLSFPLAPGGGELFRFVWEKG